MEFGNMAMKDWFLSLNLDPDATANDKLASDYARDFKSEGIQDEKQLIDTELTIPDFQKLNVKIAHRRVIVTAIEALRKKAPAASPDDIAKARFDLVVRFVAVVISVGFATRFSQMDWLKDGHVPSSVEWQELLRLGTALFVIISGWEWYHRDVPNRPLKEWPRFLVDVAVVVVSLIFLLSSKTFNLFWLITASGLFLGYVVWDALSIREFPALYVPPPPRSIWDVYARMRQGDNPGVLTNIEWFCYFLALWVIFVILRVFWLSADGPVSTVVCCVSIVVGVAILRKDEGTFTFAERTGWIASLLLLYGVVLWLATLGDGSFEHWLDSFQPKKS
jgi:hypothetical protein